MDIEASSPKRALAKAKASREEHGDELVFQPYDGRHPVNHIEILDDEGDLVAEWYDPASLVEFAAPELLNACRLLVEAYAKGKENGHIDWNDIDIAHEAARHAIPMAEAEA